MKFITSLSLHRIERQQYCLETWRKHGTITAVQVAEDIPKLQADFPFVNFVATNLTGDVPYGYTNRVRIKALVDAGPGLLINSDIKLTDSEQSFKKKWTAKQNEFLVGVRQDFDGPGQPKELNAFGIDAFLITQKFASSLPDVGFVIGVSVWDYWMVWHALTEKLTVRPILDGLLHLRHPVNWDDRDTAIGLAMMDRHYGVGKQMLDVVIPIATKRKPHFGYRST